MKRSDSNNPKSLRYKFRRKRFLRIEAAIRDCLASQDMVSVLDVGGRKDYWQGLSEDLRNKVHITLLNRKEDFEDFPGQVDDIKFDAVIGDGCHMPQFADQSFDLVHSNSVIEHVGSLTNMKRFAAETRRVGRTYYVQAPYLWFPIEPHFGVPFLHWLPGPARAQITHRFSVGYAEKFEYDFALSEADSIKLVDKMLMQKLFPDADMHKEKFALMTKSLIMVKAV